MKIKDFISVYGGYDDAVSVAPKGTTEITDLADLTAPHAEVGWLHQDGINHDRSEDATTFYAHQGGTPVIRKVTAVTDTFTFSALEQNAVVAGLRYKGQAPVVTAGVARVDVKDQTKTDERFFTIDLFDHHGYHTRIVIPTGAVGSGSVPYKVDEMSATQFEVTVLGEWYFLSDHPGLAGVAEEEPDPTP